MAEEGRGTPDIEVAHTVGLTLLREQHRRVEHLEYFFGDAAGHETTLAWQNGILEGMTTALLNTGIVTRDDVERIRIETEQAALLRR